MAHGKNYTLDLENKIVNHSVFYNLHIRGHISSLRILSVSHMKEGYVVYGNSIKIFDASSMIKLFPYLQKLVISNSDIIIYSRK
jgi:hypothetical protein